MMIAAYFIYPNGLEVSPESVDLKDISEEVTVEENKTKLLNDYELREVKAYKKMYLQEIGLPYKV